MRCLFCHNSLPKKPQERRFLTAAEPERRGERFVLAERLAKPFQVGAAQGDGAATRQPVRRVREAHEPVALLVLEQLHERREASVASSLLELDLVEQLR